MKDNFIQLHTTENRDYTYQWQISFFRRFIRTTQVPNKMYTIL